MKKQLNAVKKLNKPNMAKTFADAKQIAFKHRMLKAGLIIAIVGSSACTGTSSMFSSPDLTLVANESGINAFYDGIIGNAMAGKAKENLPETTPYHSQRAFSESGRTLRHLGWKPNTIKKEDK